jgi:hypothetical protein
MKRSFEDYTVGQLISNPHPHIFLCTTDDVFMKICSTYDRRRFGVCGHYGSLLKKVNKKTYF